MKQLKKVGVFQAHIFFSLSDFWKCEFREKWDNFGYTPGCDCSESFLASSIPDLQLDGFAVQLNGPNLEIDTDGADVAFGVGVVREPQQKARFTDSGVTDQKQLEQIITEREKKAVNY